jgi:hypothetical protein
MNAIAAFLGGIVTWAILTQVPLPPTANVPVLPIVVVVALVAGLAAK